MSVEETLNPVRVPGGVAWREVGGERMASMLENLERLTSGRLDSPETQDLGEQGRKSTACSVSARGQRKKRKGGGGGGRGGGGGGGGGRG